MTLNAKGQCCGRKPMVYKTWQGSMPPHRYCPRCDRAYDPEENEQIRNWAWSQLPSGEWVRNTNRAGKAPESIAVIEEEVEF